MTKRIKKEWQRAVKKRTLAEQKTVQAVVARLLPSWGPHDDLFDQPSEREFFSKKAN